MKLFKLFPLLSVIFTNDSSKGISLSEAQRIKENNKNKVEKMLNKLNNNEIYINKREIISNTSVNITESTLPNIVKPEDFDCLSEIADLNSQSAWLGQAISYAEECRNNIKNFNEHYETHANLLGLTKPEFTYQNITKKSIFNNSSSHTIDTYCSLDSVESLLRHACEELLNDIEGDIVRKALSAEAKAAVYGKQLHNSSFIRKVMSAKEGKPTETSTQGLIIYNQQIPAYNSSTFEETEKEIQNQYDSYQKERNMYIKIIKDKARALDAKFESEYNSALKEQNLLFEKHQQESKEYYSKFNMIKAELQAELAALRVLV